MSEVLVIGAGPTGLVSAIELLRRGVRCTVVDARSGPRPGTRCPNLWQRTQQILHGAGIGIADLSGHGTRMLRKVFHVGEHASGASTVAEEGLFPVPLLVPQSVLESVLHDRLRQLGARVRWNCRATEVDPDSGSVTLRSTGVERVRADYVICATGSEAGLPHGLERPREGEVFEDILWTQADATIEWSPLRLGRDEEHIFHGRYQNFGLVPLPGDRHRVFMSQRFPEADVDTPLTDQDMTRTAESLIGPGTRVGAVDGVWRRHPRTHLAPRLRQGRVFHLGDAARGFALPVHGMNMGIQEAANLGWKIAAVLDGRSPRLLETYAEERAPAMAAMVERSRRILYYGVTEDPERALPKPSGRPRLATEPDVLYGADAFLSRDTRAGDGEGRGESLPRWSEPGGFLGLRSTFPRAGEWNLVLGVANEREDTRDHGLVRVRRALGDRYPHVGIARLPADTGLAAGLALLIRPDGYVAWRGPWDHPSLASCLAEFVGRSHTD